MNYSQKGDQIPMYDWYKTAKIQQEAGLREMIPTALLSALVAVMGGSAIWNAAQQFNVNPTDVEQALSNPTVMEALQEEQKPKRTLITQATVDKALIESLKALEGTIAYQKSVGYFRNGKFYPYTDTNGYKTVGYGHKILKGENFDNGITPQEADQMLNRDAQTAVQGANNLLTKVPVTTEAAQVIANMVFQMGADGVAGFKNMWTALANQDYETASQEMLDSKWAKTDSPNRAKDLSSIVARQ